MHFSQILNAIVLHFLKKVHTFKKKSTIFKMVNLKYKNTHVFKMVCILKNASQEIEVLQISLRICWIKISKLQ
jgi:hypothetical protein